MLRLPRSPISVLLAAVLLVAVLAGFAGCGDDASSEAATATTADAPTIVVTTTVLGSLVTELVGDRADVQVLMPNGVDPHDFQPSAKDASRLQDADLIVMNGLELEEGLEKPIDEAGAAGVPVFVAGDHVDVRVFGEGELAEGEHADEAKHAAEDTHAGEDTHADEHGAGADDPHIWMDPAQMEKVVGALTPVIQQETGLDVAAAGKDLQGRLAGLSADLADRAATIPAANRKLVTGHESMGYFARAYGFELVGAIIPSLSSQAEPSASDLAELREQIRAAKVPAIFTEIGTPTTVADAIGDETGVRVIEVASHTLPADGSYVTFMTEVMDRVVDGLGS